MGFLDSLLKGALGGGQGDPNAGAGGLGDLASMVSKNPQILAAVASLLSTRDGSVGGNGGLGGVISALQRSGLGDAVNSWISTGPNPPVTGAQVTDALGHDTLSQFATKAGVPTSQAGSILASLLPAAIDHLTPAGTVPETNALESTLGSLLASLGH